MDKKLVSILVPVYNTEDYLNRCLESIIKQTYDNIEIILLNDCSTDNSINIIHEYKRKDSRIKVINKKDNEGITVARNELISNCSGDLIMFCDSDDYMHQEAVKIAVDAIEKNNSDCVIFKYTMLKKGFSHKERKEYIPCGNYKNVYLYQLKNLKSLYWGVLWNKCYKKSVITENNITFKRGIEDVIFNINFMKFANHIEIINDNLYYYNQTNNSLTRPINNSVKYKSEYKEILRNKYLNYKLVYINLKECYLEKIESDKDKMNIYTYLYNVYLDIYYLSKKYKINDIVLEIECDDEFLYCKDKLKYRTKILQLIYIKNKVLNYIKNTLKGLISICIGAG